MKTIVFDIETIPQNLDDFNEHQQYYLQKESYHDDEQKVKAAMALFAPTNRIVAIGMLCVEDQKGAVYYDSNGEDIGVFEENGIKYTCGSEQEILEKFWQAIIYANMFVTFNGRSFDCPVLMLRSAMNGVKCTRNLMPPRYQSNMHVDLLEQFTFYSATKKFNLDLYCKAFGIESPKSNGMTGHDVKPMYDTRNYEKIARYCAGDLHATKELYLKWRDYMTF